MTDKEFLLEVANAIQTGNSNKIRWQEAPSRLRKIAERLADAP